MLRVLKESVSESSVSETSKNSDVFIELWTLFFSMTIRSSKLSWVSLFAEVLLLDRTASARGLFLLKGDIVAALDLGLLSIELGPLLAPEPAIYTSAKETSSLSSSFLELLL